LRFVESQQQLLVVGLTAAKATQCHGVPSVRSVRISLEAEYFRHAVYMIQNKWRSFRCWLSVAAGLHLLGWCVSIFGTSKIGGPFAVLCYYSAKGGDYDLMLESLLFAIVPSAAFLLAAQLNGVSKLTSPLLLAGLALSVGGWVQYALAAEWSPWTQLSWTPYLTAVIYIAFKAGKGQA